MQPLPWSRRCARCSLRAFDGCLCCGINSSTDRSQTDRRIGGGYRSAKRNGAPARKQDRARTPRAHAADAGCRARQRSADPRPSILLLSQHRRPQARMGRRYQASIPRLTPHCCRHSFITGFLRKGIDVKNGLMVGAHHAGSAPEHLCRCDQGSQPNQCAD